MPAKKRGIVVIGLDGATWELLKPWIRNDKLPFFKKLIKEGVSGDLESTIPPMTAPAWVSFQTGVNPGKHGVFDFVEYDQETGEEKIVDANSVKTPRIWEIIEREKGRCCLINMPVTYPPPQTKRGIIVSSFLTPPGKTYTFPPKIQEELKKIGYKIDVLFERYGLFAPRREISQNRQKIYREALGVTEKRVQAIFTLSGQPYPDFFFVLFRGTDTIQHLFWNKRETLGYYRMLDRYLQEICKFFVSGLKTRPNVFIISDHGFHKTPKLQFSLYPWLVKEGFLKKPIKKTPPLITATRKIYRVIKAFNARLIRQKPLIRIRTRLVKKELNKSLVELRQNSPLWATAFGIFIKQGAIERDKLIGRLKQLEYQRKKVFSAVYKREEVYSGENLKKAPDIVFLSNPEFLIDANPFYDRVFSVKRQYLLGYHHSDRRGIFIAYGPDIKKGVEIRGAKIYDLAPTILHALDLSVPKNMDGKVLKDIFTPTSKIAKRKVKYISEKERIGTLIEKEIKSLK